MADEIAINLRTMSLDRGTELHRRISALINGPRIVCLCGSTRFKDLYKQQNRLRTLYNGNIVLSVAMFGHSGDELTDVQKDYLDQIHKRKIDLAEEVIFICPDGYIGESTRSELAYARALGKDISFPYGEPDEEDDE